MLNALTTYHHHIQRFLLLAALLLGAPLLLFLAQGPTAAAQSQEAPLNPGGDPYEINIGPAGDLWLSDYGTGEIWCVDPETAAYTVYEDIQAPSDARADDAGALWWGDGDEGRFGRLDLATAQATWWPAAGAFGLLGTQIDAAGDFWVVALGDPLLYRFQPGTATLCTYALPDEGVVDYPLAANGSIWLGDYANERVLRLDVSAASFTIWDLPAGSSPANLARDAAGDLWFGDLGNGVLARLDPQANTLDAFDPPAGKEPYMVARQDGALWYGEQQAGTIGRLLRGRRGQDHGGDHHPQRHPLLGDSRLPLAGRRRRLAHLRPARWRLALGRRRWAGAPLVCGQRPADVGPHSSAG